MFGKFFASTFTGSMIGAGADVFAVWAYIIANKDRDGLLELNPPLIGFVLGVPSVRVESAIAYLSAPDQKSRTETADGRRLLHEGGFQYRVVNHGKYRAIKSDDDRREQNREAQRRHRDRDRQPVSARESAASAHTDTDTDTDTEIRDLGISRSDLELEPPSQGRTTRSTDVDRTRFETFWQAYPRKVGKDAAWKCWLKRKPSHQLTGEMVAAVELQKATEQWQREGGQFIPHPSTWLNQGRWQDEPITALATRTASSPYGEKARRTKEAGERLMKKMGVK